LHTLAYLIQLLAAPLVALVTILSEALPSAGHRPPQKEDFTVAAFAVTAGLIGVACSFWAAWSHARYFNYRQGAETEKASAVSAIRFRDSLLARGSDAVAVFGAGQKLPFSVRGGDVLLQSAIAGPDRLPLSTRLDELLKTGKAFEFRARNDDDGTLAIRAMPIGRQVVVYMRAMQTIDLNLDYRAVLEALPIPVWTRGDDLKLRWGNKAFLSATGEGELWNAVAEDASFGPSDRDLAAASAGGSAVTAAARFTTVGNKRRALSLNYTRMPGSGLAGVAIDVSDAALDVSVLQDSALATADMLDGIPIAVAVFGKDQRLSSHNAAYAALWKFSEQWLDSRPSQGEIIDRLRETRQLPERLDFIAWKHAHLALPEGASRQKEEFWHLSGGKSLRVLAVPHLQGGVYYLFEDVSERFRREASFNMLLQVQRAALDQVEDAIAFIAPDGRLVLHNKVFGRLWRLTEKELSGEPHFNKVVELAQARMGPDNIWSIVAAGLASDEPERCNDWGHVDRADGKSISLTMSRLPNGATLVMFADVTNMRRFEAARADAFDARESSAIHHR
jgi:PAS domain-containing protein